MANTRVLVVDDEVSIVKLCKRYLEKAGFETDTATKPDEALQKLAESSFQLLLVDIRMPGMDGFELISKAKTINHDLTVLAMTGYGTVETALQALRKGVDGLILKPFKNSDELVEVVNQVLIESQQKRDAARLKALKPLFNVSETLIGETTIETLSILIIDTLEEILNARSIGIFEETQELHLFDELACNNCKQDEIPRELFVLFKNQIQMGESGIFKIADLDDDIQSWMNQRHLGSMMITPVEYKKHKYIFILCRADLQQEYSFSDLEMLVIVARQSVVAIENANLYQELRTYVSWMEDSQKAMVQAERLAATGRMIASVSHEINNPLQSVKNCLHLAVRDDLDFETKNEYIQLAKTEIERLSLTVQRMLDLYRSGDFDKKEVDLQKFIERVVYLLETQIKFHHIKVNYNFVEGFPSVNIVSDQIQQVIINLLLNAMDAINERNELREIWIDGTIIDKFAIISIEDSGNGVPSDRREQIFEPFASTKPNGTGLGLSISYNLVDSHGGKLRLAESKYGNGARFDILLPVEVEED